MVQGEQQRLSSQNTAEAKIRRRTTSKAKGKKPPKKNIAKEKDVASGSHKFSPNEIASALIKLQLIITFLLNQPWIAQHC